jgi:hypothetical protein
VNIVLGSLSTQPYERVAGLITSIQQEASAQVRAAHEAASNGVVEASAGPTNE